MGSIFGTFFEDFALFCEKNSVMKIIEKKVATRSKRNPMTVPGGSLTAPPRMRTFQTIKQQLQQQRQQQQHLVAAIAKVLVVLVVFVVVFFVFKNQ